MSFVPLFNLFFTFTILNTYGFIMVCIYNYLYILIISFSLDTHLHLKRSLMVNETNMGANGH